ncbi:MAG: TIM barrel protein [Candidatus Altiarchaeales archaeon]|nr:TIM barrel protein [Candidatus Altiarchaeales archaeon]MBD3417299.1 TIM barrel protein [Candidatus Altiarchaeales archaeon]
MRIGLATYAYSDLDVVDAVRMCLRYSDHVHISPIYPEVTNEDLRELVELQSYFGADFSVHAPFPTRGEMADLGTKRGHELFRKSIEYAAELNSDRIVFHSSTRDKKDMMIKHSRELVDMTADYGMLACFENITEPEAHLRDKHDILEFVEEVDGAKLCFDTSHYYMWSKDVRALADTIESISEHIGVVHMVDTFQDQDAHMLPGFGEISIRTLTPAFMSIPELQDTPFIFEDQEPYEYEKGILNLRHAFVSKKGMIDRNRDASDEVFKGEGKPG